MGGPNYVGGLLAHPGKGGLSRHDGALLSDGGVVQAGTSALRRWLHAKLNHPLVIEAKIQKVEKNPTFLKKGRKLAKFNLHSVP